MRIIPTFLPFLLFILFTYYYCAFFTFLLFYPFTYSSLLNDNCCYLISVLGYLYADK